MTETFLPYPKYEDKDFYERIYNKKEFFDTRPPLNPLPTAQNKETIDKLFKKEQFELLPQQKFLKNFISPYTPYRSILIYHGTGVGKTCTAINIAENYKDILRKRNKKILLIVSPNIQNEFYKTIFNLEKELSKSNSRLVVQCTGTEYQLGKEMEYLSDKQKEKKVQERIHEYYEIIGSDKLRNRFLKEIEWNGKKETFSEHHKKRIEELYSNIVLIIDEIHNRVSTQGQDESIPLILKKIATHSKDMILVLMSATPMVNDPRDILYPINLLRLNDNRTPLKEHMLFTSDGKIKDQEAFIEGCKGYISYVRGGEPPRFPYKLIAMESKIPNPIYNIKKEKLSPHEKIQYTRVILCKPSQFQYTTYKRALKKEDTEEEITGLLQGATQAGNISYPSTYSYGLYGNNAIGNKYAEDKPLLEIKDAKGNVKYKYGEFAKNFFQYSRIGRYSTKFKEIFDRIVKSEGIVFIYSQYIIGGVKGFALFLEENGFLPANITGKEYRLLETDAKPICYKCGQIRHDTRDHKFEIARYVLLTGSQDLTVQDISKISGMINREQNMDGRLIKILLGSEVSGEGIDFKRIRQVHIMEPWYNYAKLDQIEGRAIRNGSHIDLPPEKRNVEIFRYCLTLDEKIESSDERDYRISEDKDRKIKALEQLIKTLAIDCNYQRQNNLRNIRRLIHLRNSRGKIVKFTTGDAPYNRECGYNKVCNYECVWKPIRVNIDKSTYGQHFSKEDINRAKEAIQEIFQHTFLYNSQDLYHYVKKKDIDDIYIFLAIKELLTPDKKSVLTDMYKREGYLIERGNVFVFQPYNIKDTFVPYEYRTKPLETKTDKVIFLSKDMYLLEEEQMKLERREYSTILKDFIQQYAKIYDTVTKLYDVKDVLTLEIIMNMLMSHLNDLDKITLMKKIFTEENLNATEKVMKKYFRENQYYFEIYNQMIIISGKFSFQYGKRMKKEGWTKTDIDIQLELQDRIQMTQYAKLWDKVKTKIPYDKNFKKFNYIKILKNTGYLPYYVGTVEYGEKDLNKYFKIYDFEQEEAIQRKNKERSKRTELRGRMCYTYKMDYLEDLVKYLNKELKINHVKMLSTKYKISKSMYCYLIEYIMRFLQSKDKSFVWFFEYTEY